MPSGIHQTVRILEDSSGGTIVWQSGSVMALVKPKGFVYERGMYFYRRNSFANTPIFSSFASNEHFFELLRQRPLYSEFLGG